MTLGLLCATGQARSDTSSPAIPATTAISLQGEVGGTYAEGGVVAQFEVFAVADFGGGLSAFTAATENGRGGERLTLGGLRYRVGDFTLDAGRIGVPFGLTPPIYAGRRALASRPDTLPAFPRLAVNVLSLTDYGVGASYRRGGFDFTAQAYAPAVSSLAEQALLFGGVGQIPVSPNQPVRTLLGDVSNTPLDLVAGFAALNPEAAATARQLENELLSQVFGAQEDESPVLRIKVPVFHVGAYYAGTGRRYTADVLRADLPGQTIYTVSGALELTRRRYTLAIQPFYVSGSNRTIGGTMNATVAFTRFMPYIRAGAYSGRLSAVEAGAGVTVVKDRLSARLGYDYLLARTRLAEVVVDGPSLAASLNF